MIEFRENHPELDIRFVFFADNKLNKQSNTRYSDWARNNGFKYHVGKVFPDEWR